jgi:hypothetical protein
VWALNASGDAALPFGAPDLAEMAWAPRVAGWVAVALAGRVPRVAGRGVVQVVR